MDSHYTLTSRSKIYSFAGNGITVIGQSNGCDIRLPNPTRYEDAIFAKIVPDKEGEGWHIVRSTPYYPIKVNGSELNRVHYLEDGDNLDFNGNSYRFNIRKEANFAPAVTHIHSNRKMIWALSVIVALIAGAAAYLIIDGQRENLSGSMKAEIESSLFSTQVDSLQLICKDSVVDTYAYASSPTGTAFLTTDSLLITARHCIEPWLNQVLPSDYSKIPSITDWAVSRALLAETRNQLSGTEDWRVISFITFKDENGKTFSLSSADFNINYEFDEIVELGNYSELFYWRSISHRYTRRDMMLGDVAAVKFKYPGKIPLADEATLGEQLKRGKKLTFFGYPESGVNGNNLEYKTDELRLPLSRLEELPDRIFLLAHGGDLTPGFSGGPVITRSGMGFKAVGVISVIDDKNGNRSYSVPSSEISNLRLRNFKEQSLRSCLKNK